MNPVLECILTPGLRAFLIGSSFLLFTTGQLHAQFTQWKGLSSTWNDSTNWTDGVPSSTKETRISIGSEGNYDPFVPAPSGGDSAKTQDLQIQSGGKLYFANGGILVVYGTEKLQNDGLISLSNGKLIFKNSIKLYQGGMFDAGSGTLDFQGITWENKTGSTFVPGTSNVLFNGTTNQTIIGDMSFYNAQIANNSGVVTLNGNITIVNTMVLDSGVSVNLASGSLTLANSATLQLGTGSTLSVNGTFNNLGTITGPGTISSSKPIVGSVVAYSPTQIDIVFIQPVGLISSQTVSNYSINKGITISNAARDTSNNAVVRLSVSMLLQDTTYMLTVNNVTNAAETDTIGSNTLKTFQWTETVSNPPPSNPQSLVVTDSSSGTISVRWNKNSEPDFLRYLIYRSTSPGASVKVDSTSGGVNDTVRIMTGLTNGTRYYFRITAVDSAGNESGYSNEVNARPDGPPTTPQNFSATAGNGQVFLRWNQSADFNFLRYRIYAGNSTNPTSQIDSTIGGMDDTTKIITGLTNATTYYFRITAVDSAGNESGYSNEVNATPLDRIAPESPQGLVVTDSSNNSITIRWRKNTELDFLRYLIYRSTSPGASDKVDSTSGGVNDTVRTMTGLTNGTRYYIRITAMDSSWNESGYSNEVNATPLDRIAPASPQGLVVTDSSNNSITIRWRKNTELDFLRYRIYRATTPGPTTRVDSTTGGAGDTSRTFMGLTNGVRYYFCVSAVDNAGNESSHSPDVDAASADAQAPAAPANLVVIDSTGGMIKIRWQKNSEADFLRYRIYRSTFPNATTKIDSTLGGVQDTMRTYTGLINGTRYYFRITAIDSAFNESMYSNEVNSAPQVVLAAEVVRSEIPREYSIAQNYPNPFNPSTVIRYGVPERSHVKLEIFNLLGQRIAVLVDGVQKAQYYQVKWTTASASGLYLYRIEATSLVDPAKKFVHIKKMLFVK